MQVNEILRYETSHYFSIGLVDEKELVDKNQFLMSEVVEHKCLGLHQGIRIED
jgi:hypothetical protein